MAERVSVSWRQGRHSDTLLQLQLTRHVIEAAYFEAAKQLLSASAMPSFDDAVDPAKAFHPENAQHNARSLNYVRSSMRSEFLSPWS